MWLIITTNGSVATTIFSPRKGDIMKYTPEEKKQLVRAVDNMFASEISPFSILPEHCTVADVEAATIEAIHRSFNSIMPYSDEAYMAMADRLALSEIF